MLTLVKKYEEKLIQAGLADDGAPLIVGLDDEPIWNRDDRLIPELESILSGLNINSLMFSLPAEPYRGIIEYLAKRADGAIFPEDSETRTFMHDLPVIDSFDIEKITSALKQRKSAIIKGHGIITWGTVSPEQAFVSFSSVCFACFVKFFADYLKDKRKGRVSADQNKVFEKAKSFLPKIENKSPALMPGPFKTEKQVYNAITEAGFKTVSYGLVDSFFGNVSYNWENKLYISQTTSSLDELEGCIDPCALDGSSSSALTASSELTAHREIILSTNMKAILHGHPKFSVVLSLDCEKEGCALKGQCHTRCDEKRFIEDIPIVPGEVGTGPYGLAKTLPPAMAGGRGVIVYGHGLFTVGSGDFNEAFAALLDIENMCRRIYFSMA